MDSNNTNNNSIGNHQDTTLIDHSIDQQQSNPQQHQQHLVPMPISLPAIPLHQPSPLHQPPLPLQQPQQSQQPHSEEPVKKKRVRKQPTKSKMVTGYIIYASEIRKEIIKKHPKEEFGAISKIVGTEWRNLSQESKVTYEKRAQEQNSKFKKQFESDAALELTKLADVAAARAANEEKQQLHLQQQHHQNQQQHLASAAHNQNNPVQHHHQHHQLQQQSQQDAYRIEDLRQNQQVDNLMTLAQQQHDLKPMQTPTEGIYNNIGHHQVPTPSSIGTTNLALVDQDRGSVDDNNNNNNCPTPIQATPELMQQQAVVASQEPFNTTQQQQLQDHEQQSQQARPISSFDLPMNNPYANNPVSYLGYSQQAQGYYPAMIGQSAPVLIRPAFNGSAAAVAAVAADALLQQQQQQHLPQQQQQQFQIIQHQQQPISTMVQYCNNPGCCCSSGRYQPYPYPYSPPAQSTTPNSLQQQQSSPQPSPTHQQYPYKRNNIIYRKAAIIKLRPKDAATQTDPIIWIEKVEKDAKKPLKHSQKFIEHIEHLKSPNKNSNAAESH